MRIWHISDTHSYHNLLEVPTDIDMVIFSGDCSNPRDPYNNEPEVRGFIDWYRTLDEIPVKIFVAGNHDTSIEKRLVTKEDFTKHGIIYLENDDVIIDGIKIFGSPFSPTFGYGWAFNKDRTKLDRIWRNIIDKDVDIVINHGQGTMKLSHLDTIFSNGSVMKDGRFGKLTSNGNILEI